MQLRIHMPGPLEGAVLARDGANRSVELSQLVFEPAFYRPDGKPVVFNLETIASNGKVLRRYSLQVSGLTGELALLKRVACKPKVDNDTPQANAAKSAVNAAG